MKFVAICYSSSRKLTQWWSLFWNFFPLLIRSPYSLLDIPHGTFASEHFAPIILGKAYGEGQAQAWGLMRVSLKLLERFQGKATRDLQVWLSSRQACLWELDMCFSRYSVSSQSLGGNDPAWVLGPSLLPTYTSVYTSRCWTNQEEEPPSLIKYPYKAQYIPRIMKSKETDIQNDEAQELPREGIQHNLRVSSSGTIFNRQENN